MTDKNILLVGASRGLGLAIAAEFLKRDWNVTGTVRGSGWTELRDLATKHPGCIEIEILDIAEPDQIASIRDRLSGRRFDMLFVNAGISDANQHEPAGTVATDTFVRVMVTNALGPMRIIESLQDLVAADGLIGVMSSRQGSLTCNAKGGNDVYRASKSAVNQFMRCYAARHAGSSRALVLMSPGWIRTALGGPGATFGIEETIPAVVETLLAQMGRPGLRYLDREGHVVPW